MTRAAGDRDDLSALTAAWPGERTVLAVADADRVLGSCGELDWANGIASVSKLFTAFAALIAVEEGTISLDEPAGPPGATVRHLMAHASGLGLDDRTQVFGAGRRRIYSNVGMELLAEHVESLAGMPFVDYLDEGVIQPLGLHGFDPSGSPAHGMVGSVRHLLTFGRELLAPTLVSKGTIDEATTPAFADLRGVLPGFGAAAPNLWGLGFEIRGDKQPHWTGSNHAPSTFGHFGGSGSFLWVDPTVGLVGASLSSEPFGDWAVSAWPEVNTILRDRYG